VSSPVARCRTCDDVGELLKSPGGEWWAHLTHPKDGHDFDPDGQWLYGAVMSEPDDEELEVYNSYSGWHYEPLRTAQDAFEVWGPEREIVRHWVPYPSDWEKVE
jgi:hypothetical protein